MKLYVIVEGERTEPRLCRAWLPLIYPDIQEVQRPEDLVANSFYLVLGRGYPSYIQRIKDAAADLIDPTVRFVVWVDAEELAAADRRAELEEAIQEAAIKNPPQPPRRHLRCGDIRLRRVAHARAAYKGYLPTPPTTPRRALRAVPRVVTLPVTSPLIARAASDAAAGRVTTHIAISAAQANAKRSTLVA